MMESVNRASRFINRVESLLGMGFVNSIEAMHHAALFNLTKFDYLTINPPCYFK